MDKQDLVMEGIYEICKTEARDVCPLCQHLNWDKKLRKWIPCDYFPVAIPPMIKDKELKCSNFKCYPNIYFNEAIKGALENLIAKHGDYNTKTKTAPRKQEFIDDRDTPGTFIELAPYEGEVFGLDEMNRKEGYWDEPPRKDEDTDESKDDDADLVSGWISVDKEP
jgi:hypothetical protein